MSPQSGSLRRHGARKRGDLQAAPIGRQALSCCKSPRSIASWIQGFTPLTRGWVITAELIASDTRTVATFTNPTRALLYAKSNRVDTLVSDFDMPDMDGVQFALAFLDINPSARIIIMSGRLLDTSTLLSDWRFLSKPFSLEQFERCMI